jgi:hypothetical protein
VIFASRSCGHLLYEYIKVISFLFLFLVGKPPTAKKANDMAKEWQSKLHDANKVVTLAEDLLCLQVMWFEPSFLPHSFTSYNLQYLSRYFKVGISTSLKLQEPTRIYDLGIHSPYSLRATIHMLAQFHLQRVITLSGSFG